MNRTIHDSLPDTRSQSALCLITQSRLTLPRFVVAGRRDLNKAATIETTTAPEITQSVSMPASP
jgi:hypothetical protein